ncbi:MAG: BMP family ABC transporter substrate-binding protein, partial [Proteobacteria bacterium]
LSQAAEGVDVVFVAAGASGSGAFDGVEEKKILGIGVDSNQNWMKPGFILTSMLKRVDVAVYDTIKMTSEKKFAAGAARYGFADKGVDYAMDQNNAKLVSPEQIKKLETLKQEILSGKIKVPDFYKQGKK